MKNIKKTEKMQLCIVKSNHISVMLNNSFSIMNIKKNTTRGNVLPRCKGEEEGRGRKREEGKLKNFLSEVEIVVLLIFKQYPDINAFNWAYRIIVGSLMWNYSIFNP